MPRVPKGRVPLQACHSPI